MYWNRFSHNTLGFIFNIFWDWSRIMNCQITLNINYTQAVIIITNIWLSTSQKKFLFRDRLFTGALNRATLWLDVVLNNSPSLWVYTNLLHVRGLSKTRKHMSMFTQLTQNSTHTYTIKTAYMTMQSLSLLYLCTVASPWRRHNCTWPLCEAFPPCQSCKDRPTLQVLPCLQPMYRHHITVEVVLMLFWDNLKL